MDFFSNVKLRYKPYRTLAATDRQARIIEQVNDGTCEDIDDNQDLEYCLKHGDTGYFFEKPKALPKGTWLIHFTASDPRQILQKGFQGAALEHLGLTKGGGKRIPGDFALAYPLKETSSLTSQWYGNNAIVFQSDDAVLAYHKSDDEMQVIFYVPTMHSVLCVIDHGNYTVYAKNGMLLGIVEDIEQLKKNIKKFAQGITYFSKLPF